jgi:hypothetical protein
MGGKKGARREASQPYVTAIAEYIRVPHVALRVPDASHYNVDA